MTMAPFVDDPEDVRYVFRNLRELRDRLQDKIGVALPTLSMGMTNDYPVAIEEGATIVRVGSAIFGARAAPAWRSRSRSAASPESRSNLFVSKKTFWSQPPPQVLPPSFDS